MPHTFLIDDGRWSLEGNWLERDGAPIAVTGRILVGWSQDDWFTMATKLMFAGNNADGKMRPDMLMQYRGRLGLGERKYSFVLQHNQLGRVEGEGWIAPESIIQRYWVLGDRERRSGFETMHRLADDRYCLSSGIMAGHYLISAMEATITRLTNG